MGILLDKILPASDVLTELWSKEAYSSAILYFIHLLLLSF
jgi:hypothetical protein